MRRLRNGENQIQIVLGYLIRLAQEHAARLIHPGMQRMRFHQAQQLLMERLLITRRLAIQNHQIGFEAAQPPVSMRNQQLAHQSQAPANRQPKRPPAASRRRCREPRASTVPSTLRRRRSAGARSRMFGYRR